MSLVESLQLYYGLDWVSFAFGVLGILYVTKKARVGFLFSAVSIMLGAFIAVIAGQYGFIAANLVNFVLTLRAYFIWKKTPSRKAF